MLSSTHSKTAVVLFVKDEAFDLPSWIAWHISYNFDSLIIYDDGSSDLTVDVINAASKYYDVRLQAVPYKLHFQHRQEAVYMDAAQRLRDEFDWVLFIDADEYLYLPNHSNIHDFLQSFPKDVGGIAFNWRCYGDGKNVLRPGVIVPEQFEYHSMPDLFENNTVKSLVKIKQMHPVYHDPHRFTVDGNIVNPLGEDVKWHAEHHRIAHAPDWSNGAILHYVIRSAEHYMDKVKRRSDIRNVIGIDYFSWWNHNERHAPIPKKRLGQLNKIIYTIQHQISLDRLSKAQQCPFIYRESSVKYTPYSLITFWDTELCTDNLYGNLVHRKNEDETANNKDTENVLLFLPNDLNYPAYLVTTKQDSFIYLSGERYISSCLSFKASLHGNRVTLRSYTRAILVTCINDEIGENIYKIKLSADWENDWEMLTLQPLSEEMASDNRVNHIRKIMQEAAYVDNIKLFRNEDDLVADIFSARLAALSGKERNIYCVKNDIDGFPWLSNSDNLSF
ncbi:glycosyltransferase family 2 protein [Commensalibacter nepenthis]|uniref:Glycosyltransferase family 2 protein n=1 Tax=Commensalibacter nepenthis TaxID=3043872 RepID=A0ABT6Q993_9PROT|nr:glycosyltransferase family 2 protein [Commensalibacter sp. TBRC 10068]MDI2113477.1 glycosyltransferase family 2 protein [Commensalibacter sp. TBRC 10068]